MEENIKRQDCQEIFDCQQPALMPTSPRAPPCCHSGGNNPAIFWRKRKWSRNWVWLLPRWPCTASDQHLQLEPHSHHFTPHFSLSSISSTSHNILINPGQLQMTWRQVICVYELYLWANKTWDIDLRMKNISQCEFYHACSNSYCEFQRWKENVENLLSGCCLPSVAPPSPHCATPISRTKAPVSSRRRWPSSASSSSPSSWWPGWPVGEVV